ncbi:MAG: hypothetical protein ACI4U6_05880 [Acutalibacteraceae bacterium]
MKKFLKFLGAIAAIFSAVLGALAVFDRLSNKNRIKDGYLECEVSENETE